MQTDLTYVINVKRSVLWGMVIASLLFIVLYFVPKSRQREVFPFDEVCDYRTFMLPVMMSDRQYGQDVVFARDACYPPIVYFAVRQLAYDKGKEWCLSDGEIRLLASIIFFQILGVVFIVRSVSDRTMRILTSVAVIASPGCICSVLRGNPSGWAFALVCIFLAWYEAQSKWKRVAAALALGVATAVKISPCLFGVLYLAGRLRTPGRIPFCNILVAASSALILVFLPFAWCGGVESIICWMSNAAANAAFYSRDNPIWGFVGIANCVINSTESMIPGVAWYVLATRALACVLVVSSMVVQRNYIRLLFIGAAMAFVTHHDYGGGYLIPAFVSWVEESDVPYEGVRLLLEAVAWFVILTPLQFPNPCSASLSLNPMLQCESLFVLLVCGVVSLRFCRKRPTIDIENRM